MILPGHQASRSYTSAKKTAGSFTFTSVSSQSMCISSLSTGLLYSMAYTVSGLTIALNCGLSQVNILISGKKSHLNYPDGQITLQKYVFP